jgi:hypothetical protein
LALSAGVAVTVIGALSSSPAHAQLGTTLSPASIAKTGVVAHQSTRGALAWQESTDADGNTIRQYVDTTGRVYAVTWRGPAMPDVEALLGAYFGSFKTGAAQPGALAYGLHTTRVEQDDLVVESAVRLREFNGRAWLASALPAGVSSSDIKNQ